MNLKVGIVEIALLAGISVWAQKVETIVALLPEKEVPESIASLGQIEEIARSTQKQFWQLIPPVNDPLYIHPEGMVRAVNWDSQAWPDTLKKQMTAEMGVAGLSRSMYPFYRITVVETRIGERVYYNGDQEVWRTPAPLEYNPYLFAFQQYGVETEKALSAQQKIVGRSSNVGVEILLLPESFMETYEEDMALESQALSEMMSRSILSAPMAMGSGNELQMDIESLTNGTVRVLVEWLSSLDSDSLDLFHATDLIVANWQLETNFPTASSANFYFSDFGTNEAVRFYVVGTDYDEDLDLLSSARERFVHKTREDLFDTDGDGLGDGFEVGRIPPLNPLDTDSDGDGLDDGWEELYAFNPLSLPGAGEANGDPDGDGFSNREEYVSGADPRSGWDDAAWGAVGVVFHQPNGI